jgi:hypothetical protein
LTPLEIQEEGRRLLEAAGYEVPHDDLAAMGVARDYLMDLGYDPLDAAGAANGLRLRHPTSAPYLLDLSGRCDRCGLAGCDWNEGAGRYLCPRHWESY